MDMMILSSDTQVEFDDVLNEKIAKFGIQGKTFEELENYKDNEM